MSSHMILGYRVIVKDGLTVAQKKRAIEFMITMHSTGKRRGERDYLYCDLTGVGTKRPEWAVKSGD